ncbi:hypothetical protein CF15_02795 [Pyrodictium occultum]|uniref:Serine/threonine protein kinase n=1 Tax=Pyrodictium occultum TaxID=2309 RepID=A0A0V8RUM2_PYROC|nr:hypothetical protein [Pyrodictium occultum]KSW11755.1 hypothetical protein CF15_02795 [Pyrodictium occultum]
MASQRGGESAELAEARAIELRKATPAVCYPDPGSRLCRELLEELEEAGVTHYVNAGRIRLPGGYQLLGRGWAGNVFLAIWRGRVAAVKALHPQSRRSTILWEAAAWAAAAWLGAAPRLYTAGRLYLVADAVLGPRLDEVNEIGCGAARHLIRRLIWKAYRLDRLGLRHGELARPGGQVLIDEKSLEPYIVDYDSSTLSRKPGNLTQLLAGLRRLSLTRRCTRLSGSGEELREALRSYKQAPTLESLERVLSALGLDP